MLQDAYKDAADPLQASFAETISSDSPWSLLLLSADKYDDTSRGQRTLAEEEAKLMGTKAGPELMGTKAGPRHARKPRQK